MKHPNILASTGNVLCVVRQGKGTWFDVLVADPQGDVASPTTLQLVRKTFEEVVRCFSFTKCLQGCRKQEGITLLSLYGPISCFWVSWNFGFVLLPHYLRNVPSTSIRSRKPQHGSLNHRRIIYPSMGKGNFLNPFYPWYEVDLYLEGHNRPFEGLLSYNVNSLHSRSF